eukprot:gene23257-64272_t
MCTEVGAELARIDDGRQGAHLRSLAEEFGWLWIGLNEVGRAEGDWAWADGQVVWEPAQDQPDQAAKCTGGPVDNPTSMEWLKKTAGIKEETAMDLNGALGFVLGCHPDCFWFNSLPFKVVWGMVGLVCFGVYVYSLLLTCGVIRPVRGVHRGAAAAAPAAPALSSAVAPDGCADAAPRYAPDAAPSSGVSYGLLLVDAAGAGGAVDTWITRGAIGALLYALAMVALAVTMALHGRVKGVTHSAASMMQAIEFMLMCVSKLAVARTGDSRIFTRVVGCWWGMLIGGTFGVGAFLWLSGAMFVVLGTPREAVK